MNAVIAFSKMSTFKQYGRFIYFYFFIKVEIGICWPPEKE